jgi:hypothetical protein
MSKDEKKSVVENTTNSVRAAVQSTTNNVQNALENTTEATRDLVDRTQDATQNSVNQVMDNNNETKMISNVIILGIGQKSPYSEGKRAFIGILGSATNIHFHYIPIYKKI